MEKNWKIVIEEEFKNCLKKFPELENVGLLIESCSELSGAIGRQGDKKLVILFVPPVLEDKPQTLRPIIFHELSHFIDLNNPDRIFNERADEQSKKLWQILREANALKCIVEKKEAK